MFLAPDDDLLHGLEGVSVRAAIQPDVEYRIDHVIGAGSYSIAFFAVRSAAEGESPAVLKIVRPSLMRAAGEHALLAVEKETVALGRLNERVPPTPFVVRLLASDAIEVDQGGLELRLPWLAIEYVHGGAEGTTLDERIDFSLEQTGYSFDPDRVELALSCLASGVEAIHEVGVVHRDLSPHNVFCCGFGKDELFKIADFGIARPPQGATGTFIGLPGGTVGYAPPEQVRQGMSAVGPESDIFSLAAIAYKIIAGEDLFPAKNAIESGLMACETHRRSILDSKSLYPDFRDRPAACAMIDRIIARGTAADPRQRPANAWELVAAILRAVRSGARNPQPTRRRLESIGDISAPTRFGWGWTVRRHPGGPRIIRSVAWDSDGRCLAATTEGLLFWNGTSWVEARSDGLPERRGLRFVERVGAGNWLVGGDRATIAHYSSEGVSGILTAEDSSVSFTHASGDLDDLAVVVGERPDGPPLLFGLAARRWMKPALLSRARTVTGLARLEDERWLISGQSKHGEGFAAIYGPLMFEVELVASEGSVPFTSCCAQTDLAIGAVVGPGGRVLKIDQRAAHALGVPHAFDLSAVALDLGGRIWAASLGRLWLHEPGEQVPWKVIWQDERWKAPFVSVFVDVGRVVATTEDGGVIEGRWEPTPA